MIRLQGLRIVKWSVMKPRPEKKIVGGYRLCTIRDDSGKRQWMSRHRLLCIMFKPIDNHDELVVNHLDGIPGNDDLDNLEWTTYSGNTQHAYDTGLYKEKVRAVLMWDLLEDTVIRFDSLVKCWRHLGKKDENFLMKRLAEKNLARRFPDNLRFKYDDGTPWTELEPLYTNTHRRGLYVMGRDVLTGKIDLYESGEAAAFLNDVCQAAVSKHIQRESFTPLSGKVFRIASDDIDWPRYTDHQLELYRRHPTKTPRGVLVTWVESGNTKLYTSVQEACEGLNKRLLVITRLCVSGKAHFRDKFKCEYVYPDRNMLA